MLSPPHWFWKEISEKQETKIGKPQESNRGFPDTDQRSKPPYYARLLIWGVLKFHMPIHKALKNSGDFSFPWICASVLKPHIHHPEQLQPQTEQKPAAIGLIIYKHSTRRKLCHQAKLPNPWSNTRISWIHLSPSFPWLTPETRKRNLRFIQLHHEQKGVLAYYVDKASTWD